MARSYVRVCLLLLENAKLPSKVTLPFCIPSATSKTSYCSTSLPTFGGVSVLDFHLSNRHKVFCFNLKFPKDIYLASFHILYCHWYIFADEVPVFNQLCLS